MDLLSLHPWFLITLLLFAVALLQTARISWRRIATRMRWRKRRVRARTGEEEAEQLLVDRGFRVLRKQFRQPWTITVDGSTEQVQLRADLLVEKGAKQYVVEVKTGSVAPNIRTPATRRQLLEYSLAYDVDGVLLVDMEKRRIHRIGFLLPRPAQRKVFALLWLVLGAASGVLLSEAIRSSLDFIER